MRQQHINFHSKRRKYEGVIHVSTWMYEWIYLLETCKEYSYNNRIPGAAHGLSAILQMLLHFPEYIRSDPLIEQQVRQATDYMLSLVQVCTHAHAPKKEKKKLIKIRLYTIRSEQNWKKKWTQ